ncbi:FecR family protein [Parachryseolinea silvisoli]|uniref:FecR family protein n=1 Tax=Parachryseolinea silvisoli TaxID=2873601 RepID=UPI002265D2E8|nr:FecR domain-containing protein [Parachryseolinea silvisoli]MCD9020123.1 FecR domain-containing protein [Parachryseolinea silvisoli]
MSRSALPPSGQRFDTLLARYLGDHATPAELQELMDMLHSGAYDDIIGEQIMAMLQEETGEDMATTRAQAIREAIIATGREEAAVVPLSPPGKRWRWLSAAAAVVTVLAVLGIGLLIRKEEQPSTPMAAKQEEGPTIHTGKQFIHLPDGSTVLLNEGSELRYTNAFGTAMREVELIGEGYFDIQHDPSRPFRVHTGKIITTVLGTAFNVSAWPNQKDIKVTVARGKVQVGDEQQAYATLTPDQQVAVNRTTHAFSQININVSKATEWKSDYLIFDDVSLAEAIEVIEEHYAVAITLSNEKLKDCHVSATFLNGEDLDQVMTVITGVLQGTYRQEGRLLTIHGAGCE